MLRAATNSFLGINNNKTGLQRAEKVTKKVTKNMLPKIVRWTAYIKLVNVNKECNK